MRDIESISASPPSVECDRRKENSPPRAAGVRCPRIPLGTASLLALLCILFVACSSDDPPSSPGDSPVDSLHLARPVLISPAEGDTIRGPWTFTWQSATAYASYRFQISRSADFATPQFSSVVSQATQLEVSQALESGSYYWRIGGIADDSTVWSEVRGFFYRPLFNRFRIDFKGLRFEVERTIREPGDSSVETGVSEAWITSYNQNIGLTRDESGVYSGVSEFENGPDKKKATVTVYFGPGERSIDSLIYEFRFDTDQFGNSVLRRNIRFNLRCVDCAETGAPGEYRFEGQAAIEAAFPLLDEYMYYYSRPAGQMQVYESTSRTIRVLYDNDAHIEMTFWRY